MFVNSNFRIEKIVKFNQLFLMYWNVAIGPGNGHKTKWLVRSSILAMKMICPVELKRVCSLRPAAHRIEFDLKLCFLCFPEDDCKCGANFGLTFDFIFKQETWKYACEDNRLKTHWISYHWTKYSSQSLRFVVQFWTGNDHVWSFHVFFFYSSLLA